ncbi:MAG: class I SAM-dependent methyltransferase [Bacteroidales bacterium]
MSTDIFGIAFEEYIAGHTYEQIRVKIDIFDEEKLDVAYFFRTFEQMPEWEQLVLENCRGRVLDVGAGAGSHALFLQQKGLEVVAIDVSEGGVKCMQQRGVSDARKIDFFHLEDEQFDTILFLMNGAGIARRLENLQEMLEKAASLLKPQGCIYLESTDLLYMYEDEEGAAMINLAGDYYGEVNYQLGYRHWEGEPFPWLFVDYENLSYFAELAGLDCEAFYRGDTDNFIARLMRRE